MNFTPGSGTEYETVQDHAKVKLANDITPILRAAYTFGYWANEAENRSKTYLRYITKSTTSGQPLSGSTT